MFKKKIDVNDIVDKKFGRLMVTGYSHRGSGGYHYYNCLCDCGNEAIACRNNLITGRSGSCGCLKRESSVARRGELHGYYRHGSCDTGLYRSWMSMKNRCTNENVDNFDYYGGRGIRVCQEWADDFRNFLRDMGSSHF